MNMLRYCLIGVLCCVMLWVGKAEAQRSANEKSLDDSFKIRLWMESNSISNSYDGRADRLKGLVKVAVFNPQQEGYGIRTKPPNVVDGKLLELSVPRELIRDFNGVVYLRLFCLADYHTPTIKKLILPVDQLSQVRMEGGIQLQSLQMTRQLAKEGKSASVTEVALATREQLDPKVHTELINQIDQLIEDEKNRANQFALPRRIIVPAYIYPSDEGSVASEDRIAVANNQDWNRLILTARQAVRAGVDFWIIVNPNNGPGANRDPNYLRVMKELKKAGATIIGYVAMGAGSGPARFYYPTAEIQRSLASWPRLYPQVDGFFLDTCPDSADAYPGVRKIVEFARVTKPGSKVIINPGKIPAKDFLLDDAEIDVVCIFESNAPLTTLTLPDWFHELPGSRLYALAWDVDRNDVKTIVQHARGHNIGSLYVTDRDLNVDVNGDSKPDPGLQWGRLPSAAVWREFLSNAN